MPKASGIFFSEPFSILRMATPSAMPYDVTVNFGVIATTPASLVRTTTRTTSGSICLASHTRGRQRVTAQRGCRRARRRDPRPSPGQESVLRRGYSTQCVTNLAKLTGRQEKRPVVRVPASRRRPRATRHQFEVAILGREERATLASLTLGGRACPPSPGLVR